MPRRRTIEGAYPMAGTIVPDMTLRAGRVGDAKSAREARKLVAHSLSSQSYLPGYGLVFSLHRATQYVKANQDLADRMLRENSPEFVAANLLYRIDSLVGPKKFVKERRLLRQHGRTVMSHNASTVGMSSRSYR